MARRYSLALLLLAGCASPAAKQEALRAHQSEEYARAVRLYSEAIEENPADFAAYYGRGAAKLQRVQGREVPGILTLAESAAEDFSKAIELWPIHGQSHYLRGLAYVVMGRFKEAARDLIRASQLGDETLKQKAHRKLAMLYDEKFEDQEDLAREHLERYVALGGGEPVLLARLSELRKLQPESEPDQTALDQLAQAKAMLQAQKAQDAAALLSGLLKDSPLGEPQLSEAKLLYARARVEAEKERQARSMFSLASRLASEGKRSEALLLLSDLIARFPATQAALVSATDLKKRIEERDDAVQ